jgi:hypothetical protein
MNYFRIQQVIMKPTMNGKSDEFFAISPLARDPFDIPDYVSLTEFLFRHLNAKLPLLKGKPWVVSYIGRN